MQALRAYTREHKEQAQAFYEQQRNSDSEDDLQRMDHTFTPNAVLGTTQRQLIKGAISRPNDLLKSSMQSIGTLDEIEAEQQRLR